MSIHNKKIVITGGAGFLGSHVARLLLENDNDVVILDDFSNGKMLHLQPIKDNPRLVIFEGDITRFEDVRASFAHSDIAIHLAVLDLRQSIKEPQRVGEVIIQGTLNSLEAAREYGVELFLNCSSSEVYGSARYVPMDENHPLNPETPYAAAKVAQDMYVYSYGRTYGLPWTTIRPFNMYGPHSHWQGLRGELIPKMIVRAMNHQPLALFGDGTQARDFIHVEDAARALLAVADSPSCRGECINFCSGIATTVQEVATLICRDFDLDPATYIRKYPSRPGDVRHHCGDNSRFKALLDHAPRISLEDGLRLTIDWFNSLPFTPEELLAQEVLRAWEE